MARDNPRVTMPFGGGLDRETGIMAMRVGSFEDLQNVMLHQGKAIVRPGFNDTLALVDDNSDPVTHVIGGIALKSEQVGIVVSYQLATEKVWVHRISSDGLTQTLVGEWAHDRGGWGSAPPVITLAESYGNIFMAHDRDAVLGRASTLYYNSATALTNLQGDFEGSGSHDIRFRGVVGHLKFMFGWGYGNETTDRPELVRSSVAGDPTSFSPNHYFIAGDRGVPVLNCGVAGKQLQVLKQSEGHVIVGTGRDNFGIFLVDPLYGCLNSALAANYGGDLLAWSAEGPRLWSGSAASEEIAIPLELAGLEPAGLVAEGEMKRAFAHYLPGVRMVAFVFGARVYGLTVRVAGDWKWSYWSLGFEAWCGFTLLPSTSVVEPPTGWPGYTSEEIAGSYADVTVTNNGQDGDETLEAWVRLSPSGAWALNVSAAVALTSTQVIRVVNLTAGTDYDVSLRYRRGTLYATAYEGSPETWPATSQGSFTTTIDPPTAVSGVWSRTSAIAEQILVTCTPVPGLEANDIEVWRQTGGSPVLAGTISGPHSGNATFIDDTIAGLPGELYSRYQFVTKGPTDSPLSTPAMVIWAGPPGKPTIAWSQGVGSQWEVSFDTPDPTLQTEAWDNYDLNGGLQPSALRVTAAAGATEALSPVMANVPADPGLEVTVIVKQIQVLFAVTDYSDDSAPATVVLFFTP